MRYTSWEKKKKNVFFLKTHQKAHYRLPMEHSKTLILYEKTTKTSSTQAYENDVVIQTKTTMTAFLNEPVFDGNDKRFSFS